MTDMNGNENFRNTTAVALDGSPIVGEVVGVVVTTPSGRTLFDMGENLKADHEPHPSSDAGPAIRDWRDAALLRILSCTETLMREKDGASERTPASSADDWMETEQAAVYLKLKPKTVRDGAVAKRIPGHKYPLGSIRGRWRFKKAELDRHMTKRAAPVRRTPQETIWN